MLALKKITLVNIKKKIEKNIYFKNIVSWWYKKLINQCKKSKAKFFCINNKYPNTINGGNENKM